METTIRSPKSPKGGFKDVKISLVPGEFKGGMKNK